MTIRGFPVAAGKDLCFFEDGRISAFDLSKDTVIDGLPCMAGSRVWLTLDDGLAGCTVSDDVEIGGSLFRRGSLVVLDENGVHLRLEGREGASCLPPAKEGIQGGIITYANGRIRGRLLLKEEAVKGTGCSEGSWVWYHEDGGVSSFVPSRDVTIGDVPCRAGRPVHLYQNGKLLRCYLSRDAEIRGIPASSDTFLLFHENGALSACRLAGDLEFQGIRCKRGRWIGFHEDASLKRCFLAEDIHKEGVLLKAGAWASFHRDGRLECYTLTEDAIVQGLSCNAGDTLLFDVTGRLSERVSPPRLP
jgi:hypothetical protein